MTEETRRVALLKTQALREIAAEGASTRSDSSSLGPCPFCASEAVEIIVDEDEWEIARVECRRMTCRASGPHVNLADFLNVQEAREAAIDSWNLRTGRHA